MGRRIFRDSRRFMNRDCANFRELLVFWDFRAISEDCTRRLDTFKGETVTFRRPFSYHFSFNRNYQISPDAIT